MGGFDYPYGYEYDFDFDVPAGMTGTSVIGVVAVIYLLVILFSLAVSMVTYILHSYGLYSLAQRRGIRNSWLAWIPLGNLWILGSISDQFQYLTKGRVKNRRKTLLTLGISVFAICFIWFASMIVGLIMGNELVAVTGVLGGILLLSIIAITLTVLQYMSYYDLFSSCEPGNGALYLILSILFSITLPIFVFICRKKDGGMPPRRQPAQTVVIPTVETIVDPNVVEKVVIPTVETVVDPDVVEEVVIPTVETVVDSDVVEEVVIPTVEPVDEGFAQPEEFEE